MKKTESLIDFLDIQGRKITFIGRLYTFFCILTLGILHILCGLFPSFKIFLISKECNLKYADCVVISNKYNKKDFRFIVSYKIPVKCNIKKYHLILDYIKNNKVKVLDTEYGRFIYNVIQNRFVISKYKFNNKINVKDIIDSKMSYDTEEEKIQLFCKEILYGKNHYNLRLSSSFSIFIENTFNLTVFINFFCTVLYIIIDYVVYAIIVSLIFLYGYFQQIYSEISINNNLRNSQKGKKVTSFRNKKFVSINANEVVPGDLIVIDPCKEFSCDALLIKGDVISDESFLTGENVPICKSSIQKSIIHSGTSILRSINVTNSNENTNYEALHRVMQLLSYENTDLSNCAFGLVIGTGFNTVRGKIMKDIINPKPAHIEFLITAYKSIGILSLFSFIASNLLFYILKVYLGWDTKITWTYVLDLFFSLASPTLYASLNIGMQISNQNLKKEGIYCLNLDRIYLAGNVEIAIFDKTGTLTNDGMELLLVDNCTKKMTDINEIDEITKIGLSACHSVYELNGKYSGDTLDLEMLIFSKSKLEYGEHRCIKMGIENEIQGPFLKEVNDVNDLLFYTDTTTNLENKCTKDITILNTVDFTSESRMMSVVLQVENKKYYFCKGSPDKIGSILKTKPESYEEDIRNYSLNGYRVIAMAYKEMDKNEDLQFLCLIVFSNKLKAESIPVVVDLKTAEIQTCICTGDNILTAISVARECKIIDDSVTVIFPVLNEECKTIYDVEWVCLGESDLFFDKLKLEIYKDNHKEFSDNFVVACEGKEYEYFKNTLYKSFILEKGKVFARFSPAQKKSLVEDYRNLNKNVLFCGDGANDSGAIGTADVGIALAQNEASLASSFCAANINAVPILIKECRNAYVTSLGRYKFAVMTNFIIYFDMFFLVIRNKFFTDFQSLHLDIILIFTISYYLTNFKRSEILSVKRPNRVYSNLSLINILLITLPIIISNLITILLESSYTSLNVTSKSGTYIFFISSFQIIFSGLFVADCTPFREGIYNDKKFLRISGALGLFNFLILFLSYCIPSIVPNRYQLIDISTFDLCLITLIILSNGLYYFGVYAFTKKE